MPGLPSMPPQVRQAHCQSGTGEEPGRPALGCGRGPGQGPRPGAVPTLTAKASQPADPALHRCEEKQAPSLAERTVNQSYFPPPAPRVLDPTAPRSNATAVTLMSGGRGKAPIPRTPIGRISRQVTRARLRLLTEITVRRGKWCRDLSRSDWPSGNATQVKTAPPRRDSVSADRSAP